MSKEHTYYSSSPLVMASRKARWIFDGLDTKERGKVVLLAQCLAALAHGYEASTALPSVEAMSFENLSSSISKISDEEGEQNTLFLAQLLLGSGLLCQVTNLSNKHSGNVIVICGNKVKLENVTIEGRGERNFIVICNGATLSNVTLKLDGMRWFN